MRLHTCTNTYNFLLRKEFLFEKWKCESEIFLAQRIFCSCICVCRCKSCTFSGTRENENLLVKLFVQSCNRPHWCTTIAMTDQKTWMLVMMIITHRLLLLLSLSLLLFSDFSVSSLFLSIQVSKRELNSLAFVHHFLGCIYISFFRLLCSSFIFGVVFIILLHFSWTPN